VITGIGMVTPCGLDRESTWEAVCAGRSGIGPVSRFDVSAFPSKIAGEVRGFDPSSVVPRRETTTLDRFQLYALAAALEAAADAGLDVGRVGPERVGVVFGVGLGGIESMERSHLRLLERGPRLVSPFLVPMMIPNMAASHISLRLGAKGPCEVVTTACASGAHALAAALRWIRDGLVDVVVAGGAEAAVTPLSLGGFCAMRALSTRYNDRPTEASRPFDAARDGFVLAEGAAAVVLEARDRRDLQGYAELAGSASTSDAHHITQPDPEGRGQARCLALALADAGLAPEELDLINAHGTSTAQNDPAEAAAIIKVLGTERARTVRVNATKSMTGHMLGAAGAVEAALCALTLSRGIIPPTLNLENPDQACNLGHVIGQALKTEVRTAASNSFGFGGTNATLVLTKSS
jgi:3-oxoacyl-[acyl-carrier-protein] synthase II